LQSPGHCQQDNTHAYSHQIGLLDMPTTLSFPPREQILNHPLMLGSVVCWINLGLMSGFYVWKQIGGTAYPSRLFSLACLKGD
jgi:hypothetical protein